MSTSTGTVDSTISYFPFGLTWTGSVNTTKEFTGQRLDGTSLYYYNARYYDPQIGRFISPDATGQYLNNPQTLNRYSYCQNNPLNRTDPTGHFSWRTAFKVATVVLAVAAVVAVSIAVPALVVAAAPAIAAFAPVITGAIGGAVSYTATKIAVNTVEERPALEGFSPLACATNAAAGACFGQAFNIIGNAILNQPIDLGSGVVAGREIGTYDEVKTPGFETHHLVPVCFTTQLNEAGLNPDENPCTPLTHTDYVPYTNAWREEIPYSNSSSVLNTNTATIPDIWNAAQKIYSEDPDYLDAVNQYLHPWQ